MFDFKNQKKVKSKNSNYNENLYELSIFLTRANFLLDFIKSCDHLYLVILRILNTRKDISDMCFANIRTIFIVVLLDILEKLNNIYKIALINKMGVILLMNEDLSNALDQILAINLSVLEKDGYRIIYVPNETLEYKQESLDNTFSDKKRNADKYKKYEQKAYNIKSIVYKGLMDFFTTDQLKDIICSIKNGCLLAEKNASHLDSKYFFEYIYMALNEIYKNISKTKKEAYPNQSMLY